MMIRSSVICNKKLFWLVIRPNLRELLDATMCGKEDFHVGKENLGDRQLSAQIICDNCGTTLLVNLIALGMS